MVFDEYARLSLSVGCFEASSMLRYYTSVSDVRAPTAQEAQHHTQAQDDPFAVPAAFCAMYTMSI